MIVNLALYVPLGMSGYLAFRRFRVAGPVALGLLLSASVEMLQLFVPGRHCSTLDLINNTVGSGFGVLLGVAFEELAGKPRVRFLKAGVGTDRAALALLFCWVGGWVFPLFPVMNLPGYRAEFGRFLDGPVLAWAPLLSDLASWFVAGRLLTAAGFEPVNRWLALSLLLVPGQFFIATRQPFPVDFLGSFAGVGAFLGFGRRSGTARVCAAAFLGLLLFRGLSPFHFAEARPFIWTPFGPFLDMTWQEGLRILLGKVFYYGSAVWLLREAGPRWSVSTAATAMVLGAIEALQTRLPGHSPEITDPLLAILLGAALAALSQPRSRSAAERFPPAPR